MLRHLIHPRFTFGALALVAAGFALFSPAPATVGAQPAAPVSRPQQEADIGPLNGNNRLVVFSEDRGAGARIYAMRVRSNGYPIGGQSWEATAPTGTGADKGMKGEQRFPALLGGSLLVWSEKAPGSDNFDIYAQRIFSNGRSKGKAFLIVTGPGDQLHPDIIGISNGLLVVYSEDTTDEGDVMGARITNALSPRGLPFPIASGLGVAADPTIAVDPTQTRNLLVLFEYKTDTLPTKDIYGTRIVESGLPRGGSVGGIFPVVETDRDEYAPSLLISDVSSRRVRGGSQTSSLLLYVQDDPVDGPDVLGQRIRTNGFLYGNTMILAGGPGAQSLPASMSNDSSEWLVLWQDDAAGSFDLFQQRVRTNGIPRPRVYTVFAD